MNRWLHRFAVLVALSTLFLIFVGGLVTSNDAGLSVPDWPLSYGRLMPPMIGGIFYEHGHRMVATGVGFLTVVLAILFSWKEKRPWLKKAAWGAVILVIAQGVLGGMTVLFLLPKPISIAHASLAQTFFCLTVAMAVWSSRFWESSPAVRHEPKDRLPMHRIALGLFALLYVQLILGAVLRHTGKGVYFHIAGGLSALSLSGILWKRAGREDFGTPAIRKTAALIVAALGAQIALGFFTFFVLRHRFDVIPMPVPAVLAVTAHVALGAFILGSSLILFLILYRTRPTDTPPIKTTLMDYFELTKPGISLMAGATALAGFVVGSRGGINYTKLIHTCIGTLMVAASAGIFNMLIERNVDARMRRTEKRPLPSGRLKPGEALLLGSLLSIAGILYLSWAVNLLTALLAGLTLSVYLYVYTPLKKITSLCVTIGAVAGALPPVMGWAAATGRLGVEALVLFGILFFWQFPHFLALAWLYKDDYARAGFIMLPDLQGPREASHTAVSVLLNSLALLIVSCLPTFLRLTGSVYLGTSLALGGWLFVSSTLFFRERTRVRARQLFIVSVIYMPLLVASMILTRLPSLL